MNAAQEQLLRAIAEKPGWQPISVRDDSRGLRANKATFTALERRGLIRVRRDWQSYYTGVREIRITFAGNEAIGRTNAMERTHEDVR